MIQHIETVTLKQFYRNRMENKTHRKLAHHRDDNQLCRNLRTIAGKSLTPHTTPILVNR